MAIVTAAHAPSRMPTPRSVVPIVALDVRTAREAEALVRRLDVHCDFYKVGLELFTAEGPSIVRWLRQSGKRVFLDLKLHDIPNTVRGAARNAASLGVSLLTVHASGGSEMVRAAVEGAREAVETTDAHSGVLPAAADGRHDTPCGILGVTILTSLDGAAVDRAWGRSGSDVVTEVVRLAGVVREGGGVGIVCSGHEAAAVTAAHGAEFGTLVPGIRLPGGPQHDQRRVMTPRDAAAAGARWIILGRAVTGDPDPVAAILAVHAELASGS
ncbi:MAG TPA: orotidine-5'-phosphate decarboxylase [Gemmatimonas sp.]|nr:orotidine-5'-phosphate decarboxylase [Gemmatimonas sp.]